MKQEIVQIITELEPTSLANTTATSGRRAVSNLIARHAFSFTVNFLGTLLLTRSLGPESWGTYTIAYTVQVIGAAFLERSAVGVLVQRKTLASRLEIGSLLTLQLLAGVALAIAGFLVALSAPSDGAMGSLLMGVALSIPLYAARAVPVGILERALSYRRVAVIEAVEAFTFNAIAVIGVTAGFGLEALAIAMFARAVPPLLLAWWLAGSRPIPAMSITAARELVAFGLPYTLSNSLGWVNLAAAPVLVGGFLGTQRLGVLQLAFTLVAYPQVLTAIIARVTLPLYSRIDESRPSELAARVGAATSAAVQYVGGAMLGLAASVPAFISWLYGSEWNGASAIVMAIAPSFAVGSALVFVVSGLNAAGHARSVLLVSAVFSVTYWAAATPLVLAVGALGLPIAYSVASTVLLTYVRLFARDVGQLFILRSLTRLFLCSLVFLFAAIAAASELVVLSALIGLVIIFITFSGLACTYTSAVLRRYLAPGSRTSG